MLYAISETLLFFAVISVSLLLHEAGHLWMARRLGDASARLFPDSGGPVSFWEPLGLITTLWMAYQGVGLGWNRPAPINPLRFANPRRGMFFYALSGPATHAALALLCWSALGLAALLPVESAFVTWLLSAGFIVNISLGLFNLLPLYPLDGHKLFAALLPRGLALQLDFFALRFGMWPLVILLFADWFFAWTGPVEALLRLVPRLQP